MSKSYFLHSHQITTIYQTFISQSDTLKHLYIVQSGVILGFTRRIAHMVTLQKPTACGSLKAATAQSSGILWFLW